jgi:putative metalloprotease
MDMMSDDEIRYVIGHEIGHVQAGHSRKRLQLAMSSARRRQAVAATGGSAAALAESDLGELFVKVVRAQHSQGNENEADDFAMRFLSQRGFDRRAAARRRWTSSTPWAAAAAAHWLSTHPAPRDRAERMRRQAAA